MATPAFSQVYKLMITDNDYLISTVLGSDRRSGSNQLSIMPNPNPIPNPNPNLSRSEPIIIHLINPS